jgi:hypothetical protein
MKSLRSIALGRLVMTFILFALLSSCVTAPSRQPVVHTSSDATHPEIQDVPYQARGSRDSSPRKRVLVLPFIDSTGKRSDKAAQSAREVLLRALIRTDGFVIVGQSDFPNDIARFLKNGEYDLEAMAKIGSGLGLAAIIEGKVIEVKARRIGDEVGLVRQIHAHLDATVQVRVVATRNGKIVLNDMRSASTEDTTTRIAERSFSDKYLEEDPQLIDAVITKAFQTTVPRIAQAMEKLSWEGRVALVKGEQIFLNAGRLSGLQIGDILKVMEDGEDVFDPETGALIGKVPGRLKGTLEVVSYFGKDGAVSVIHSGAGFHENDLVELY